MSLPITGNPTWANEVHLIEAGEPASAGRGAPVNRAAEELANRTAYLKSEQDKVKKQMNDSGLGAGNAAVVVVSETEPANLPVGGFWLQPVAESASGDAIINRSDIEALFGGN